ncbi:hypothetical protein FRC03_006855 [Tulasnella sp. 419]|nr:hypothetical protein FRC03_006855 [Tulasnella sp. 419]
MERNVDFVRIIILKPKIVDGKPEPLPQSNVGICRLVMFLSGSNKPRHTTNTYKHSVSPVLESATEFSVPIKNASAVIIKVIRGSRLWQGSYDRLKNATDLKNVEAILGGKSDPYVRVLLNGVIKSQQQSGIIILDVKSGTLTKKARLEVFWDDSYWPTCSTEKSRSTNAKWDQVERASSRNWPLGVYG